MGAAVPVRPARKASPLPKLLQAVLIVSAAGMLALWTSHLVQSSAAGEGGPPRLLLQGALELAQATEQPGAALHVTPDGDAGLEQQLQEDDKEQQDLQAAEGAQAVPGRQEPTGAAEQQQQEDGWELSGDDEQQAAQQPLVQQAATADGDDEDDDDWSEDSSSSSSSSSSPTSSSSASASLAGGSSAADDGADGPDRVTLDDDSDLATFADPGTRCVVTPSHGKVGLGHRWVPALMIQDPAALFTPPHIAPRHICRWRCCSSHPKPTCRTT